MWIIPDEARHWLGRYLQLSGHDLLFQERISANPLLHCFDSGLSPQTFQTSWLSPVFNPPELLVTFNCPTDEQSWIFNGVKSSKIWKQYVPQFWRAITATRFSLTPHSMLTLWQTRASCLGTSSWRESSPKTAILTTLLPHCLQLWTTWKL